MLAMSLGIVTRSQPLGSCCRLWASDVAAAASSTT
jgi:hypothetical protein